MSTLSLLRHTKPLRCTSGSSCVSTLSAFFLPRASSSDDFQRADPENGPDLVIGADTVVLTHAQPVTSDVAYSELPGVHQDLLEKPDNKEDNLRMLQELNGTVCEVVTGVSLGEWRETFPAVESDVDLPFSSVSSTDITWIRNTVGFPF
jgi:predicted house-cleaning NTP pyrophosphatase (Maf/HAM1 superfamily)